MATATYGNPGQRSGILNSGVTPATPAPAASPKKKSKCHLNLGKYLHKKCSKR